MAVKYKPGWYQITEFIDPNSNFCKVLQYMFKQETIEFFWERESKESNRVALVRKGVWEEEEIAEYENVSDRLKQKYVDGLILREI